MAKVHGGSDHNDSSSVWVNALHPAERKNCLASFQAAFKAQLPFQMEYQLRRHEGIKEENLLHRCEKVREKAILRRRALIGTVFDELKNLCQIEHTRHRSAANFVVNLMAGIMAAYCLSDNKPNLSLIGVNLIPSGIKAYPELRLY
jgi:hypothetical protein